MSEKLLHDSTETFKPIIYQFYIALEKCFELVDGESVYIETYGDVTVSSDTQIEVKDYKKDLTDLDHNIWKTLKNWLDINFDESHYKTLILLSTQNLSSNTSFKEWNIKDKNQKLQVLKDIETKFNTKTKQSKSTKELLETVMDKAYEDKLLNILEKFVIDSSALNDEAQYEMLKQRYIKIISINKDNVIDALSGYIISPFITSNRWEITYQMFSEKFSSLVEEYASTTKIFPKKYSTIQLSEEEEESHSEHQFVKKIEEINYHEVKTEAISDFVHTRKIIAEELQKYQVSREHYKGYENEIHRSYLAQYRNACLDANLSNQIKNSKKLYNAVTGREAQPFKNFNDTPIYFRNGLLHEIADDKNNEKNIVWKLKVEDE